MASYSMYPNANFQSFVRPNYNIPVVKRKYDYIRSKAQVHQSFEASRRSAGATVYASEYGQKQMDETSKARMRPTSPTRMNKPHPPEIFLVTQLHNQPGYYNCEKGPGERLTTSRRLPKGGCDGKQNMVKVFHNSSKNLAAQAWMKLASDKDCDAVEKMIACIADTRKESEDVTSSNSRILQMLTENVKPELISSAHRWLSKAGSEETAAVERLLRTLSSDPQIPTLIDQTGSSCARRAHRSQYVIHPEWRIAATPVYQPHPKYCL
ncbi:uncharacterized protein RCH25_053124 [Pelodytes ibericus]